MEKELLDFCLSNKLTPFSSTKTPLRLQTMQIYKTKEAKTLHQQVISSVTKHATYANTANIWNAFPTTKDAKEIAKRQSFFKKINEEKVLNGQVLKNCKVTPVSWKPPYDIVVVTENEQTFTALQKRNIPAKILFNEQDVSELQERDIVQVLDCEQFGRVLEQLPQSVFLSTMDEAYVERYVQLLSQYQNIINLLKDEETSPEIAQIITYFDNLLPLLQKENYENLSMEKIEQTLEQIKDGIGKKINALTVSGDALLQVMNAGTLPPEIKAIVKSEISASGLPQELFLETIPVTIDTPSAQNLLRKQSLNQFASLAETIKLHAQQLSLLPSKAQELKSHLLLQDFKQSAKTWMQDKPLHPQMSSHIKCINAQNHALENPHPITFHLQDERCSILTGANSGGKTTLLEHILQLVACMQLGLPAKGEIELPLFSEVYYFAKNKGSMSKGAFETLLSQMNEITPGENTLILADEIEAVTEPGVAGKMINATAEYFIKKNCYLVIATHLGHEIQKSLPIGARIDGIEAKGLSEDNELLIDHSPVLGRLAHSTPELIIEKMAKTNQSEYFAHLYKKISTLS